MKTVSSYTENTLVIKNSKFICSLFPLKSLDEISNYLGYIKKKYPKATHYCYAYIFNDYKKCYDDSEPSRTAGIPILNVLEKENISNVLCVVTRYFGGIKLGAGGLIRAYSKSVSTVLINTDFIELKDGYIVLIKTSYNNVGELDYFLAGSNILDKSFLDEVTYKVMINSDTLDLLRNSGFSCQIIKKCLISENKV